MPQKSKKPTKKALARASSRKASSPRSSAKPQKKAVKRSASPPSRARAKTKAKLKAKLKAKVQPKAKLKPKVQPKAKLKPKVQPKAKLKPKVQPKVQLKAKVQPKAKLQPKAKAHAVRSLILPPKPKRLVARLLVAPAPRPASIAAPFEAPHLQPAPPVSAPRVRAVQAEPAAAATQPSLRVRERQPRARLTLEIWRKVEALSARLGREPLSDEQRVAIRAALEGHDCLVVLADDERAITCYQLAAAELPQPTLVVSPAPAELRAQSDALSGRSIAAVHVPADLAGPERSAALSRIARGGSLLVLLSPEALRAPDVRQALAKSGVALAVVEEAHCASDASHELRPSYAELGNTLGMFDAPPIMALTRVATSAVRRDIRERLGLSAPVTVQGAAVRPNVKLVTRLARGEGRQASLVRLVERLELPGVVFCATPHDADSVYGALRGAGISAHRYHGGMTASDRATELLGFTLPGQRAVMVAVSAFAPGSGLPGIGDSAEGSTGFGRTPTKRDLRFVVHYQSPASLEQYLREAQRAGADGAPAIAVLLHESSHRSLHEVLLAQQRFKATHLAELGRALETPALEGRSITLEALALGTGQSRRTTDRLTALLADAGVVSRASGWIRVLCTANELDEACRRLGAQLYALREQDARRLASVSAFAESAECKLSCLSQYLGEGASEPCGRCNACESELLAPSLESLVPQAPARRAVVHEFSVQPATVTHSCVVPSNPGAGVGLSASLADLARGRSTRALNARLPENSAFWGPRRAGSSECAKRVCLPTRRAFVPRFGHDLEPIPARSLAEQEALRRCAPIHSSQLA